jgi:hypothetical protein
VEEWLSSTKPVLWITGEAGVGKSAVAAWLCDKRPEIVAYHFCRFGNADRVDARRVLFSLAYQLSTQFPIYQDRLNASQLDKTAVEPEVPTVFDRLFVNLLTDAVPLSNKPRVMLIDALDEATRNGRNELASLFGHELDRLPSWFRMIVTSRPYEQEINSELQALDPWKIDAGREENLKDIRTYLYRELRPFTGNGTTSDEVVDTIVDKSEGLFLYVTLVREELKNGRLSLARLKEFPQGLGAVYLQWFQRYFPDIAAYQSDCRPALEAICAAREPLPRNYLEEVMGWSGYEIDSLAERLGSLFPFVGEDERVRAVHQSLRDWLTDHKRSGPFRVDIRAGEQRLADFALQQYKSGVGSMSDYSVVHAPSHFAACQKRASLKEWLLNPDWIQAKLLRASVVPLLADYDLALNVLSLDPDKVVLDLIRGTIRLSTHVIAKDPGQFASQVVGRLLSHRNMPAIAEFSKRIAEGAHGPWFRSTQPTLHPPGTALLRTLSGHSGPVYAVAVTPDGQRAVSASSDHTLKVWDLARSGEPRVLTDHSEAVIAVAVTPDGQRAVSGSENHTLTVWDLASGRALRTVLTRAVYAVAVTPDGQRAVSASDDDTLRVWDLASGRALRTLSGHSGPVTAVAVTPDGKRALSACWDNTLKIWELETGEVVATFTCDAAANCCSFSAALELIVAGDDGGQVHVLHLEEPEPRN